MKKYLDIAKQYESFYKGQEDYYHDFRQALWTVIRGVEIINTLSVDPRLKSVYAHAMALRDAGHSNGVYVDDVDNVFVALSIFDKEVLLREDSDDFKMARSIILATTAPYSEHASIEEIVYGSGVSESSLTDLQLLIEVARDVDHLGIIGIRDGVKRKQALVALFKEYLVSQSKEAVLLCYKKHINLFSNQICFYTDYGKTWAKKNLRPRLQEQLDYSEEAIELACV